MVNLFSTPLQRNLLTSKHKTRHPNHFAPDENIPAAFYTKDLLHRTLHPIHNLFLLTARKSQKVEPLFFSKNWQLYFSMVNLFSTRLQRNLLTSKPKTRHPKHFAPDENIPAAFYTKDLLHRTLHPIHNLFLLTARKSQK